MKYQYILSGILICLLIEFFAYNLNHKYSFFTPYFSTHSEKSLEKREGNGKFTNPLLECLGIENDDSLQQLHLSEAELQDFVSDVQKKYDLNVISVYVRDLNNGPWVGVNQMEKFIGGSLLKVPILISYYKLAEIDPSILQKKIKYSEKLAENNQYFAPSKELEIRKEYTVEELIQYMTDYSDNNAAALLSKNIAPVEFDKVFESLGFGRPDINKPYPVDAKTYASFFRVLFNASYLNKDYSERALENLTHSEFDKGLKAYLPNDLIVSHKFGIRSDGDLNQLHDCGIVYYPNKPYLICVMSRGGTFDNMAESIAEVSKYVYDKISEKTK